MHFQPAQRIRQQYPKISRTFTPDPRDAVDQASAPSGRPQMKGVLGINAR
jgi:hypothetical protein